MPRACPLYLAQNCTCANVLILWKMKISKRKKYFAIEFHFQVQFSIFFTPQWVFFKTSNYRKHFHCKMFGDLIVHFIKTKISLSMILQLMLPKRKKHILEGKTATEPRRGRKRYLDWPEKRTQFDQFLTVPWFRMSPPTNVPSSFVGLLLYIFFQVHSRNF